MAYFSPREIALLAPCRPELAPLLLLAMQGFEDETGHKVFVMQGFRTLALQQQYYNDSLSASGVQLYRVAKPGSSRHELGSAADLGIVGVPDQKDPLYDTLGKHIERVGLKWGGRFSGTTAMMDKYHAEILEPYAVAVAKYHTMRASQSHAALAALVAVVLIFIFRVR